MWPKKVFFFGLYGPLQFPCCALPQRLPLAYLFWFYALGTVLRHLTIAVGGPDKQSQSQSLPTYDKKKLTLSKHNDPVVEKYHYHPTALSKCPCNLHSDLPPENAISNLILIFLFFFLILLLSSLILQIYMLSLPPIYFYTTSTAAKSYYHCKHPKCIPQTPQTPTYLKLRFSNAN